MTTKPYSVNDVPCLESPSGAQSLAPIGLLLRPVTCPQLLHLRRWATTPSLPMERVSPPHRDPACSRVATVSSRFIATMGRSDFSLRILGLAVMLSPSAPGPYPTRTQRDLPRSRAVPFRPCQRHLPDRLSCRASGLASAVAHLPGRLPFTFVPAWSLSETLHPSASRPKAVFDYGGIAGHTSAPGWT
jgi:hypothetical protein